MIQQWFDVHKTLVLVGRDQYDVVLDNHEHPTEMWSTILYSVGDTVTIDNTHRNYRISCVKGVTKAFSSLRAYKLEAI